MGTSLGDEHLEVCSAFAACTDATVLALRPVVVSEQTPLSLLDDRLDEPKSIVGDAVEEIEAYGFTGPVAGVVRTGHSLRKLLARAVDYHDADLTTLSVRNDENTERLVNTLPCDAVTVRGEETLSNVGSVLVPVADGPHSRLAATIGGVLSNHHEGRLTVIHVVPSDASDEDRGEAEELLLSITSRLDGVGDIEAHVLEENDRSRAIIGRSEEHDCTVIGGPQFNRLVRLVFDSPADAVRTDVQAPTLTAWDQSRGWNSPFRGWRSEA